MKRTVWKIVLGAAALLLPAVLPAAEGVKFRHVASVYADAKGLPLRDPQGVECGGKAHALLVADTGNGRVVRYDYLDGAVKGGTEIKVPEATAPLRAQADSKGVVYILDGKKRRIALVSPEGRFMKYLDPEGLPAPGAFVPKSFRIDPDDNIYLLDILSERVVVLDPAGKHVRQIPFPEKYGFISDLAVDRSGTVLLVDSVGAGVYAAAKDAKSFSPVAKDMKEYMNFPTSIATDARGRIFLGDRNGAGVVILGRDGSFVGRQLSRGWKDGLLQYPADVCVAEDGDVFVADQGNGRIQVFSTSR